MTLGNKTHPYSTHSQKYVRNSDGHVVGFECSCGIWFYAANFPRMEYAASQVDYALKKHDAEHAAQRFDVV